MPAPDGQVDLIRLRRDSAGDWSSEDPTLEQGEVGLVLSGAAPTGQFKIGDGGTPWTDLPLFTGGLQVVNEQIGASYTLALSDANQAVMMNRATAQDLVIPAHADVPFPVGTRVDFWQEGAGAVTVSADGAANVEAKGGALTTEDQYASGTLLKVGTDEWRAFGALI